jgi:hypothetical protein
VHGVSDNTYHDLEAIDTYILSIQHLAQRTEAHYPATQDSFVYSDLVRKKHCGRTDCNSFSSDD